MLETATSWMGSGLDDNSKQAEGHSKARDVILDRRAWATDAVRILHKRKSFSFFIRRYRGSMEQAVGCNV
jgi:hypothetical protein